MCSGGNTSVLAPTHYSSLRFQSTPAATSTLRAVQVIALSRLDPVTGAVAALPSGLQGADPVPGTGPPAACSGVVVGVHFLFQYKPAVSAVGVGAQISDISLSLVIADVVMPASGEPLVLDMSFSITWANASVPAAALQLAALCQSNNATKYLEQLLGDLLQQLQDGQVMLGVWGNADPVNVKQWVAVQTTPLPATFDMQWDNESNTCYNLVTGFDLKILTGVAYATNNLQSKVLYAQLCFQFASWSFNAALSATQQSFPMTFTVKFIPKRQQTPTVALKPAPPLLAPLPPDLFYPFLTSNAAAIGAGAAFGWQQMMALGVGLVLLVQEGAASFSLW
eukprot:gene9895-10052_t